MQHIEKEGKGVIVLTHEPQKDSLSAILQNRNNPEPTTSSELRDYGIGAQILQDLGVKKTPYLPTLLPLS